MKIPNSLLKLMLAGAGSAVLATTAVAMTAPERIESSSTVTEKPAPEPTATPTPEPEPVPDQQRCIRCGRG